MKTSISDFIDVREKLTALGYRSPSGLAVLPVNLDSAAIPAEVRQQSEAATLRTLFRQAGIPIEDVYDKTSSPPYVQNNDASWIAPIIFVTAGALSENSNLLSVALGVLSNYLTDFFKGKISKPTVRATIVVEQTKTKMCKRVEYEGGVEGLRDLADIVRELQANGQGSA